MRELLLQGSHSHNAQRKLFSVLHHRERSEADVNFVMEYLATELLFFQELPNAAKRAIATHAICQHVRPGVQILKESDSALALYLVWSGSGHLLNLDLLLCWCGVLPDLSSHIFIFANRKIFEGEEVTYDYQFPLEENEGLKCNCGSVNCSKRMN